MSDIDWLNRVFDVVNRGRYVDFLLALIFVIANFLSEPLRWHIYTSQSEKVGLLRYFYIFSFTAMSSYMLPFKLGIPFRIFLLKEKALLPLKHIVSLMAFDGMLYYLLWMAAAAMAGVLYVGRLEISLNWYYVLGAGLVALLVIWSLGFSSEGFLKRKSRFISNKFMEAVAVLRNISFGQYFGSVSVSFLDIVAQIFRHYFIFKLVGAHIALIDAAAITSISIFAGMASMMPMGLIGYDATMVLLLQKAGVSLEVALLVPVVNRGFSIATSMILGAGSATAIGYTPLNGVKGIRNRIARK